MMSFQIFLLIFAKFLIFSSTKSSKIPQNLKEVEIICEHSHWLEFAWAIKLHPELFTNPDTSKHYIKCQLPEDIQVDEKVKIVSATFPDPAHAELLAKNPDVPKTLMFIERDMTELMPIGISDIFTNIVELKIFAKKMKFITRENFAGLTELKTLRLGSNKFGPAIPFDAFYELPNVEEIDLYRCGLKEIHEDTFINNLNLKDFDAPYNDIKVLPAGIFRNNPKLENVNLDYNDLTDMQVDFSGFKYLKKASFEKSKDYNDESDY